MKFHTIAAVLRRNVQSYFSGALGYLVIVVFVFVCSVLAFNDRFFANNLATLDELSRWYPTLLLFLVPAITMSIWADERKQHTDELLFTLPASDLQILLGKYLACLAVYSIALLFSMTLLAVLSAVGDPDWGVIATTYAGYWLAGGALLCAGMFASSLTRSTTVAFVVGVLISAVPVFFSGELIARTASFLAGGLPGWLSWLAAGLEWFGESFGQLADTMLLENQLRGFTEGLIPLSGILYFVSLAAFMLYLNFVVITKRHWSGGKQTQMGMQYSVRVLSLAAVLVSFNVMLQRGNAYVPAGVDLTAEKVHTLAPVTREMIEKAVKDEDAITIHAFLSPEVPEQFVHVRKQLISLLRQYDRLGGSALTVRIVDVQHATESEREAHTRGIMPISHRLQDREGRIVQQDVYLGVVIEGGEREVVIPNFQDGMQIEYELTRSLATVTAARQLRVGILRTDARVLGMGKPWYFDRFVRELRKQYDVVDVSHADLKKYVAEKPDVKKQPDKNKKTKPDSKDDAGKKKKTTDSDDGPPDVLLVIQPTSLTQPVMDDLVTYLQAGHPAILFADPLPFYLVYDQTRLLEEQVRFLEDPGARVSEIIDAPRLRRAHPRSLWALELIPKAKWDQLIRWWREEGSRQPIRSPQQFEFILMQKMQELYPEAVPQISAMSPAPKADGGKATTLMDVLGLTWEYDRAVVDLYNPHPGFAPAIPEKLQETEGQAWPTSHYGRKENTFLFLSRASGNAEALNSDHPVTKDLREVMAIYGGAVSAKPQSKTTVTPLLQTSGSPHVITWDDLTETEKEAVLVRDPSKGIKIEEREARSGLTNVPGERLSALQFPQQARHVLAENPVRASVAGARNLAVLVTSEGSSDENKTGALKVVFVADADMIADVAFRQQDALGKPLDNMSFVQNMIEWLASDERFIELRSRRPQRRTLTTIQDAVNDFRNKRLKAEQEAKELAKREARKAQERFDTKVEAIRGREGLDLSQRDQLLSVALRTERKRLELKRKQLDKSLKEEVAELKDREDREIREYQARVRALAVGLTPLPALFLGLLVFCYRWSNERRHVVSSRRV